MKQNIYKIQLRKICHRTAAGRCLHCPVSDCERILEALNILHTDRARSAKAGFSRRRTNRLPVRLQKQRRRMFRASYIL